MDKITSEKIFRLQKSLSSLRKIAGWSAEELGEQLDVTRQTIVNLENGQTKMSKIQYMAIRLAFATEIQSTNNNTLLELLDILVDRNDVSEAERMAVQKTIDDAANTVGRRAGSDAASKVAIKAVKESHKFSALIAGGLAGGVAATAVSMLFDILKGGDNI